MSNLYRRLLLICIFTFLFIVGTWIRALAPVNDIPPMDDAVTALVVAKDVDELQTSQWQGVDIPQSTVQHHWLAAFAEMVSTETIAYRNYTFLPLFLSVLFLPLVLCLGWRKNGGIFYASDGPLWALAFAVVSPVAFMGAASLTPFTLQCVLFLLLLVVARSYARWPGHLSMILMGAILAFTITISVESAWCLLVFIAAILFAVGWVRLSLYWRTTHVVTMVVVTSIGLLIAYLCDWLYLPQYPQLETDPSTLWMIFKRQITWLCVYGVGIFAWGGVLAIAIFNKDSRWERLFAIFFPICFILGLFLKQEVGLIFVVPVAVLTPIMVALVLSRCPKLHWRWWMGNLILIGLCIGFWAAMRKSNEELKLDQVSAEKLRELNHLNPTDEPVNLVLLHMDDQRHIAQILWTLRGFASGRSVMVNPSQLTGYPLIVISSKHTFACQQLEDEEGYCVLFTLRLGNTVDDQYYVFGVRGQ